MSRALQRIAAKPWVLYVNDERKINAGIVVMLVDDYEFANDPGCVFLRFDTVAQAIYNSRSNAVRKVTP